MNDMSDFVFALSGSTVGIVDAGLALDDRNRAVLREKQKQLEEERKRYALGKQKQYVAERNFEHLKREQEQLKEGLKFITDELEKRQGKADARLQRIEVMLAVRFNQLPKLPEQD